MIDISQLSQQIRPRSLQPLRPTPSRLGSKTRGSRVLRLWHKFRNEERKLEPEVKNFYKLHNLPDALPSEEKRGRRAGGSCRDLWGAGGGLFSSCCVCFGLCPQTTNHHRHHHHHHHHHHQHHQLMQSTAQAVFGPTRPPLRAASRPHLPEPAGGGAKSRPKGCGKKGFCFWDCLITMLL